MIANDKHKIDFKNGPIRYLVVVLSVEVFS